MLPNAKKSKTGQLNPVDRLSDLPGFIVHRILSFLNRKEVCRTSILSKTWVQIYATIPVLWFSCDDFSDGGTAFMEYVETRMQRYSKENLCINTFSLEFPYTDEQLACKFKGVSCKVKELACKIDEWLEIAVRNQVTKFVIEGLDYYKLPDILFSARSLNCLRCSHVEIPYYKDLNLVSLVSLDLSDVVIEDFMLNHIISSCLLLKYLVLSDCRGLKSIVIPCFSKLETLDIGEAVPVGGTLIIETSSLTCFQYMANGSCYESWPLISKPSLLRNLSRLEIYLSDITDEVVGQLLSELTSLESLKFCNCYELTTIKISSTQLKDIDLNQCDGLLDVVIDAPSLKKCRYNGQFHFLSFTICSQANCDISLHIPPHSLDTEGFLKLKKLMTGLSSCTVLKILLLNDNYQLESDESNVVQLDEEELVNLHPGPPCYVRELKLNLLSWIFPLHSISAFLDSLFWTCHPDIISLHYALGAPNLTIEFLIRELKNMAKRWSHPLRHIEAGVNCSNLFNRSGFDIQLRLYW